MATSNAQVGTIRPPRRAEAIRVALGLVRNPSYPGNDGDVVASCSSRDELNPIFEVC